MPEGAARIYRFGPFVLDVGDRSLKRLGIAIPLTPKTLTFSSHLSRMQVGSLRRTCF